MCQSDRISLLWFKVEWIIHLWRNGWKITMETKQRTTRMSNLHVVSRIILTVIFLFYCITFCLPFFSPEEYQTFDLEDNEMISPSWGKSFFCQWRIICKVQHTVKWYTFVWLSPRGLPVHRSVSLQCTSRWLHFLCSKSRRIVFQTRRHSLNRYGSWKKNISGEVTSQQTIKQTFPLRNVITKLRLIWPWSKCWKKQSNISWLVCDVLNGSTGSNDMGSKYG